MGEQFNHWNIFYRIATAQAFQMLSTMYFVNLKAIVIIFTFC